jgi:hypothetical protein
MSRQADIRRALAIYNSIKGPLTQLIDLGRSIATDAELLEAPAQQATAAPEMPRALRKYSNEWIQRTLNTIMSSNLNVDGK